MVESCTVYVALLNEGTSVWSPVLAQQQTDGTYLLLGPVPEGEKWEFNPGEKVLCKNKTFSGGEQRLVAFSSK